MHVEFKCINPQENPLGDIYEEIEMHLSPRKDIKDNYKEI